jgi:threonine synthase
MRYISTRGHATPVDFVAASLGGLAPDGGLYWPETFPQIPRTGRHESYAEAATRVLSAFAGDSLAPDVVRGLVERAYAPFAHRSTAPLVQIGPAHWMMELHHGPTLAFKDVAMRFIAQLYDHVLSERGERMTILCATSGDTGGAAAAAFAGSRNIDVVILHPHERISPTQRLFMTATGAGNVHNLALDGDFDGAQSILKELFADDQFRRSANLAPVNSINWARIAAQVVYFAHAQAQLGADTPVRFVVPTGNFGDALAAYVAARCGLLHNLDCTVAVNANDAMARLLAGGALERGRTVPTVSPAMDIQIPSNFERLLFEAVGRDGAAVAAMYGRLASHGAAETPRTAHAGLASTGLQAERVSDVETLEEIARSYAETGWLICPHTAVAIAAARRRTTPDAVTVSLATAHAAKFPETIRRALGIDAPLPLRARAFTERPEVFERGPMDAGFVRDRILSLRRAAA